MDRRIRTWVVTLGAMGFTLCAVAVEIAVDLKHDDSFQVSVSQGTDDGVTAQSDFEVLGLGGAPVAVIYPLDLYDNLFWSQPLAPEAYAKIEIGMTVRPVVLSESARKQVRTEGTARGEEIRAAVEQAKRAAVRDQIEKLRAKRESLLAKRDELDGRIASAEEDLFDAEARVDSSAGFREDDIDRALQTIGDLSDQRDELQLQREALSNRQPYPRDEILRLTDKIRRLNSQIDSERRSIRTARDWQRQSRSTYLSRKDEWRRLVAEHADLTRQIRSLTDKIQALSSRL